MTDRRIRPYTERELERLRSLSRTHSAREIAALLGRTVQAIRMKIHTMGLQGYDIRCESRLDHQQVCWLKRNFPHVATSVCASILGISPRTVVRLARKYHLEKTETFIGECQRLSLRKARESHLRNGTYPPKGVVNDNLKKGEAYRFRKKADL